MPIVSKTIKIKVSSFPPKVDFIEEEIKKQGLEPLRWAIVDVDLKNCELTLSVSGKPE